ncbi:MAG: hypothetical protein ACM3OC_03460 [Deltaproteobacteria bacterium]
MKKILLLAALALAFAAPVRADDQDAPVTRLLDRVKVCYEQADPAGLDQILALSMPDRGQVLERFRGEISDHRDIRLVYAVQRKVSDAEGAVWDVRWEWRAQTRSGAPAGGSVQTSIRFSVIDGRWQVTGVTRSDG